MKAIFTIVCLFSCLVGFAQFSDSVHYHVKYASTGVLNRTNENSSYILNNALNFSIRKKTVELNARSSYVYGKQNQLLTNSDFAGTLDGDFYQTQRFYYWVLGNYTSSRSLKIANRYQTGVGIAYKLIDNTDILLNVSNGILYESSDLYLADSTRELYQTFRNSFRLIYKFSYKNIITLNGTHYVQNSLQYAEDYIIRSNNSLSVKLTTWLSLTASLLYNRVNRAASENLLINYGITIEKYF